MGQPEEGANVFAFLLSDEADFVTDPAPCVYYVSLTVESWHGAQISGNLSIAV